jgi:hypothetical protein
MNQKQKRKRNKKKNQYRLHNSNHHYEKYSRTYYTIESYRKIGRSMSIIIEHILTTYGQR